MNLPLPARCFGRPACQNMVVEVGRQVLQLHLKGKAETILVTGDDSQRSRASKFKQIESGHFNVVLSTGQFFGEGLDVRGINCLVLAFPFSFEGKLAQYIGRLRDSGTERVIIDYRDKEIPFLERQYKQRARFYKRLVKGNGVMVLAKQLK